MLPFSPPIVCFTSGATFDGVNVAPVKERYDKGHADGDGCFREKLAPPRTFDRRSLTLSGRWAEGRAVSVRYAIHFTIAIHLVAFCCSEPFAVSSQSFQKKTNLSAIEPKIR